MADATNLPALQPLTLSQPLAEAIVTFGTPHPDALPDAPPRWMMPEIRAAHAKLGDALAPTDAATIVRWIAPLASMVSKAPEGRALRVRVQAMAHALTDLPRCCWTPETQRQAARTFRFWPSVAEIAELVTPAAQPLRHQRAALQRMMFVEPSRGSPEERRETSAERASHAEANRRAVEAMRAQLDQREREDKAARRRRVQLTPDQLAAHRQNAGLRTLADANASAQTLNRLAREEAS
ncbi:hypothetical protein KTR66_08780 [Roseococcus sp. SDR]|uniref:hypothetical protein n=1 Tax=Roseococcus sp. SDR TaxID=2835532 RepID=UPI001BCB9653|nr:hypothetical protein [Roseococcus sp. SDR]MBS7790087.1 hypothetical protein [Roseococcus sp. SDR]MBV1845401.1 hypothetical protein [Roseococcus sp. SDR]